MANEFEKNNTLVAPTPNSERSPQKTLSEIVEDRISRENKSAGENPDELIDFDPDKIGRLIEESKKKLSTETAPKAVEPKREIPVAPDVLKLKDLEKTYFVGNFSGEDEEENKNISDVSKLKDLEKAYFVGNFSGEDDEKEIVRNVGVEPKGFEKLKNGIDTEKVEKAEKITISKEELKNLMKEVATKAVAEALNLKEGVQISSKKSEIETETKQKEVVASIAVEKTVAPEPEKKSESVKASLGAENFIKAVEEKQKHREFLFSKGVTQEEIDKVLALDESLKDRMQKRERSISLGMERSQAHEQTPIIDVLKQQREMRDSLFKKGLTPEDYNKIAYLEDFAKNLSKNVLGEIPKSKKEITAEKTKEEISAQIANAKDVDELKKIILSLPEIKGGLKAQSGEEVVAEMDRIIRGGIMYNITPAYNIRYKLAELLKRENEVLPNEMEAYKKSSPKKPEVEEAVLEKLAAEESVPAEVVVPVEVELPSSPIAIAKTEITPAPVEVGITRAQVEKDLERIKIFLRNSVDRAAEELRVANSGFNILKFGKKAEAKKNYENLQAGMRLALAGKINDLSYFLDGILNTLPNKIQKDQISQIAKNFRKAAVNGVL